MQKFILIIVTLFATVIITTTFAFAGKLVIKGSTTVLPIAQKVVEA